MMTALFMATTAVLGMSAVAETETESASGWVMMETAEVPSIYPGTGEVGALLSCRDGKYSVAFSLDGTDFEAAAANGSRRARQYTGALKIDGETTYEGPFVYRPQVKLAVSPKRKPAAQVFNAVVRGQDVTFSLGSKGSFDMDLPPMDDTFRAFASACKAQTA